MELNHDILVEVSWPWTVLFLSVVRSLGRTSPAAGDPAAARGSAARLARQPLSRLGSRFPLSPASRPGLQGQQTVFDTRFLTRSLQYRWVLSVKKDRRGVFCLLHSPGRTAPNGRWRSGCWVELRLILARLRGCFVSLFVCFDCFRILGMVGFVSGGIFHPFACSHFHGGSPTAGLA